MTTMAPMTSNIPEWPGERVIFPVHHVELRVQPGPHPYFLSEREAIAENWTREIAANPALFDGEMVLARAIEIRDGAISGEAHVVPYSALLLWRKTRPLALAVHMFGLPVIVSADGAVIAIRMGRHTANPGRVYCAAGSLDPEDVRDGICDFAGNMAREVMEETGLDLSDAESVSQYHALHDQGAITLFRTFRFSATAAELVERIGAHIAADPTSEIEAALAIRNADPGEYFYPGFMPPILERVFNGAP